MVIREVDEDIEGILGYLLHLSLGTAIRRRFRAPYRIISNQKFEMFNW